MRKKKKCKVPLLQSVYSSLIRMVGPSTTFYFNLKEMSFNPLEFSFPLTMKVVLSVSYQWLSLCIVYLCTSCTSGTQSFLQCDNVYVHMYRKLLNTHGRSP